MIFKSKYILGLMSFWPILMASCTDFQEVNEGGSYASEQQSVTLSVSLPEQGITSRAGSPWGATISDGSKVDLLVFCIYEEQKDGSYEKMENDEQHTLDMSKGAWPATLRLSLDPEKKYKVVLWAQSSKCTAYDTSDLKKVKISYNDETDQMGVGDDGENVTTFVYPANNDEYRDAFWGITEILTPGNNNVVLHRPFAQINIATTGADYKNLIYDPRLMPSYVTITESTVTVNGVANCLDTFTGEAYVEDEKGNKVADSGKKLEATFSWAALPAWINSGMPQFKSDGTVYEKDKNPFVKTVNEEFLYVSLNQEGSLKGYIDNYPTLKYLTEDGQEVEDPTGKKISKNIYQTETFKYLSMCYVLVPSKSDEKGTTVTVSYDLRQKKGDNDPNPINLTERTIRNVPVQADFRTNILGGLYHTDKEPDPTSIYNLNQLPIIIKEKFIEPAHNSRYYTANIDIVRSAPTTDGLKIENVNGQNFPLNEEDPENPDKKLENEKISQSVFFTGESCQYIFSFHSDYKMVITSNVAPVKGMEGTTFIFDSDHPEENSATDQQPDITDDETQPGDSGTDDDDSEKEETYTVVNWAAKVTTEEDKTVVTFTIYPGATAGTFSVKIDPKNPDEVPDTSDKL